MELRKYEIELIAMAIDKQKQEKDYNKGFQNRDKREVWKNYSKTSLGRIHNKVMLKGVTEDIYKKAFETPIETKEKEVLVTSSISEVAKQLSSSDRVLELKNVFYNFNNDKSLKEVSVKPLSEKLFADYSQFFDKVFVPYGSKTSKIEIINRANKDYSESTLRVIFIHRGNKIWNVEFPFINKDGFFSTGNNIYAFMFTIENMKEIIQGEKKLKLEHPYVWLSKQLLKAYSIDGEVQLYTEEIFDRIIFNSRRENVYKLQLKLMNALRNTKENPWDETKATPIVWFDKHSSSISKYSYTRNILIDSCYSDLVKIGLIEGLDLLTGSTSTPAKRVKPAACWDIIRHGAELILERVKDNTSIIEDYAGEFKCSFPAFVKTSAKRDNSCTIKDTVDFTNPQEYQRKFILK